ncbi:MAG TPA: histidine phosphatase family protein [Anaerolineae bacterium]|nr:histidine phosphatase family protein [Anaerolineae bacterium]
MSDHAPEMTDLATIVILVRHGQSTWNAAGRWQGQGDPPLSDVGREQARVVAQRLRGEPIAALYASDLRRAAETAEIIGQTIGLRPQLDPRLRELDVGGWSGMTIEEIAERFPEQYRAWRNYEDVRPGGGEMFREMRQRAAAALEQIAGAHPGRTVCLVTHGGIVYALRGHALGQGLGPELFQGLPPNRNTAVTTLHLEDGTWRVGQLMDAGHLDEAGDQ